MKIKGCISTYLSIFTRILIHKLRINLVCGGAQNGGRTLTCEINRFGTKYWNTLASLTSPLKTTWKSATLDNHILFFPYDYNSIYEYDVVTNTWKIVGMFQEDRYKGSSAASEVSLDSLWKFCKFQPYLKQIKDN